MSTVVTVGPRDPPQTTTNVVGVKRIRKNIAIAANVGTLTIGDIRLCLPLDAPELRIMKLSVWGPDSGVGAGGLPVAPGSLSVVFPVGSATNSNPGDNSVWVDEGTSGQQRAQIHLRPCFEYRNFWFLTGAAGSTVVATFGLTTPTVAVVIVDVTLQYRTAIQSCPALEHLRQLQAEEQLCVELFQDDGETTEVATHF
jgi:hypothetical protein